MYQADSAVFHVYVGLRRYYFQKPPRMCWKCLVLNNPVLWLAPTSASFLRPLPASLLSEIVQPFFFFLFALRGTVAWPKPALHHWKHLMIIQGRPTAWIKLPASCLSAQWERRLERFGCARVPQFLCVPVWNFNVAWHRVKFIRTALHCSTVLLLLLSWQHYVK